MSDADFQHISSRYQRNAAFLDADSGRKFHLGNDDSARKIKGALTLRQLTTVAHHFLNSHYFGDTLNSVQPRKENKKTQKAEGPQAWLS